MKETQTGGMSHQLKKLKNDYQKLIKCLQEKTNDGLKLLKELEICCRSGISENRISDMLSQIQ